MGWVGGGSVHLLSVLFYFWSNNLHLENSHHTVFYKCDKNAVIFIVLAGYAIKPQRKIFLRRNLSIKYKNGGATTRGITTLSILSFRIHDCHHKWHSITTIYLHAECRVLFVVMLSVIMLNVGVLSVVVPILDYFLICFYDIIISCCITWKISDCINACVTNITYYDPIL
jgi:hypothetical protein